MVKFLTYHNLLPFAFLFNLFPRESNVRLTSAKFQNIVTKTSAKFDINAINDVEISNDWTNQKWHLSPKGLKRFKTIFSQSKIHSFGPTLKPGHYHMIIKSKRQQQFDYYIYMYSDSIFLDGGDNIPIITIFLKQTINWDKLK